MNIYLIVVHIIMLLLALYCNGQQGDDNNAASSSAAIPSNPAENAPPATKSSFNKKKGTRSNSQRMTNKNRKRTKKSADTKTQRLASDDAANDQNTSTVSTANTATATQPGLPVAAVAAGTSLILTSTPSATQSTPVSSNTPSTEQQQHSHQPTPKIINKLNPVFLPKPTLALITASDAAAKAKGGNSAISVFNIYSAFILLASGASGASLRELQDFFGFSEGVDRLVGILQSLKSNHAGCDLYVSNAVYCSSGVQASYLTDVQQKYDAVAYTVDFKQPASVVELINGKVSAATHGKIPSLLPLNAIDALTKSVLVSVLYFKGAWANPFKARDTQPLPFYVSPSAEPIMVPTMTGSPRAGSYVRGDNVGYLVLPYKDKNTCFVVEMSLNSKELPAAMSLENVHEVASISPHTHVKVDVSLPKFSLEASLDLIEILKMLHVHTIFEPSHDFTKMYTTDQPMLVSAAIHKVVVEVNENGTEAAAATAIAIMTMSMMIPEERPRFVVDRPFHFHIVSVTENVILFSGTVRNPL